MALYNGIEIDDELVKPIRRMENVVECQASLLALQSAWDNLILLGHLSSTGANMVDTRQAFHQLTSDLLNQLGRETLDKTVLAMRSKAQVSIDIMIRNLFERTADIGFLAMDFDVRNYINNVISLRNIYGADEENTARLLTLNNAITERFQEYTNKYSVYSNIILLDPSGNILVQLDKNSLVEHTTDPLIQQTLDSSCGYVETFRPTALLPGQGNSLIYSSKVTTFDNSACLGVLCLCFRFINETEDIFSNLIKPDDWSIATLLDANGMVIASSDPQQIPISTRLPLVLKKDWEVVRYSGREYLATSCPTQGYQGYMGPGWYGHIMLPLEHAFENEAELELKSIPDEVLAAVMSNQTLFSDSLRMIPVQSEKIQRSLNRSVWNGNIKQRGEERQTLTDEFSKVLLREINNTGVKTQDIFERSIANLHETVVSSILQDSQFQAALAIDIMDRNLYERANDCRWWALAGVFRQFLASPLREEAALLEVQETLAHINSLYTVYDNLVLFDQQGKIISVSNSHYQEFCGQQLEQEWVRQALTLHDSQSYTVSPFAASRLYNGRHTYIYAAAIFALEHKQEVKGGIGIIFDAEPQFNAMLLDALPKYENGDCPSACFGVFATRDKQIIASTCNEFIPGETLPLDGDFFKINNGEGISRIAELNGQYYAVGAQMSKGYREYKGAHDDYHNDVVALIFVQLGNKSSNQHNLKSRRGNLLTSTDQRLNSKNIEIATFYVENEIFAIRSEHIVEAIDANGLSSVPGALNNLRSYILFRGNLIPVVGLWQVINNKSGQSNRQNSQIIVINTQKESAKYFGIMVDDLGEIVEIPSNRFEKLEGCNILTESVIKPELGSPQGKLIMVLSTKLLLHYF